jgi:hypothetical protein
LISLLKDSIKIENLRLPTVISVFLAEALMILIEPGTSLYKPIVSFFLLKPTLDFTNVPEFYKLFNSSSLQYKLERKWILNILVSSCRTSLDYRLYEKRFVYRQLMSIYNSKMSDLDIKLSILSLIYKTSKCKFSLIDLIKRHYLLIWLTNITEQCLLNKSTNNNNNNQQTDINIFYKLIQIYILIWNQLGSTRTVKATTNDEQQIVTPPLTFLNQMFILMKIFLAKLVANHLKIMELKFEFISEENNNNHNNSINLGRLVIRNFFKVKRQIIENLKIYNLNLMISSESSDNLDNELNNLDEKDLTYENIDEKIQLRKRVCSGELNGIVKKKLKTN